MCVETRGIDSSSLNGFRRISKGHHQHLPRFVTSVGLSIFLFHSCFQSRVVAVEPAPLTTILVADGLRAPVYVTHAPGDFDRIFIVERPGRIRILDISQEPPVLQATPFLDIQSRIRSGNEQGLLGLAFHPNYATHGRFFVNYTDLANETVVAEYTVSKNPDTANTTEIQLLKIYQPRINHNGGWITFGPDGYLYIAMGDGASGNDYSQDITNNLLGKMLRLDVDGDDFPEDPTKNYGIPADNPFVGVEGDDEIWAYGLRNPWRNAFDRQTGDLYIADVGSSDWEEINFQSAASSGGENYGWWCMEADVCTGWGGCTCFDESLTDPIHVYSHAGNPYRCSITGGEVYRGCAIPGLSGTYFFADFCSEQIWSFRYLGSKLTELTDRTFELDPGDAWNIRSICRRPTSG